MLLEFQHFDDHYLERLRSGDFTTQQHFFAHFDRLIRLKVSQRLCSDVAIEEVRRETFARVLRSLSEKPICEPERLGAFVNSVCTHVLREHNRLAHRGVPDADRLRDSIPDPTLESSDKAAQRQVQQEVRQVLDELSEKDRCLMKALFLEERDKDEVCRSFGVDREYLRALVHRGKQAFKSRCLKKCSMQRRVPSVGTMFSPSTAPDCRQGSVRAYGRAHVASERWLRKQSQEVAEEKLRGATCHNHSSVPAPDRDNAAADSEAATR